MTATINISRKRGDTRRMVFVVKADGVAVDVSGWTGFKLTVDPSKAPVDDTTKLEQMTGAITSGGTDGRVHFIPTGTIEPGKWRYDVQGTDTNSEKVTICEGEYLVTQDITKT